jgi:hypothetical protein
MRALARSLAPLQILYFTSIIVPLTSRICLTSQLPTGITKTSARSKLALSRSGHSLIAHSQQFFSSQNALEGRPLSQQNYNQRSF